MKQLKSSTKRVKETYLQKEKRGLQEKLFNPEILSRPDVTGSELAMIAGVSRMQIYRLLHSLGMDVKNGYKTTKTPEEIQDTLWNNLTCAQAEALYTWARDKRFSEKAVPKKRAYHLSKEGMKGRKENRRRTPKDDANDKKHNADLVKNAGIPLVNDIPGAEEAKDEKVTISGTLHDFITTNSSTEEQVNNLLSHLLFGAKANTEAVKAMAKKAKEAKDFNEKEWAFDTMYSRSTRKVQMDFDRAVRSKESRDQLLNSKTKRAAQRLLRAYWQNKNHISLNDIKK